PLDAIPPEVRTVDGDANALDLAEAIFGTVDRPDGPVAGRVFFEDARCLTPVDARPVRWTRVLSSPKPAAVQHYLLQTSDDREQMLGWDDPQATLRGHKLYWHRPWAAEDGGWSEALPTGLRADALDNWKRQRREIAPLDTGTAFSGRIRFENL